MSENPNFLQKKYNLHNAPEVKKQAERTEARSGEKVPQDPSSRIQNYLDRFTEILEREDPDKRERGMEAIKRILHRENIIGAETATEQYIKRQKRMAHEQGHGDIEVPASLEQNAKMAVKRVLAGEDAEKILKNFPNEQKQLVEEIVALVEEQKNSLDNWVDYLASPDATYPDWLKYWAIRNILSLSSYDKDKKVFPKRAENTTNPFPDLNREALAYVLDAIAQKSKKQAITVFTLEVDDIAEFQKLLAGENFAKLYAWAIEKVTPASAEALAITTGKWIKYKQGADATPLVQSLQKHGTGWCTAGESVAQSQLSRGDFFVYYSMDDQNKPTVPRAAIRMEGNTIAEVRGIAENQNLDSYIAPVVQAKMAEFPDGKAYEKKAGDMKLLTVIENKVKANKNLTKDDLIFLYEINNKIEGFGYSTDPRIKELRDQRNPKADAPIVLECSPEQIAWNYEEVNENTKAYIGPLFPGIFTELGRLEHIYTSFPEGKIRRESIEIGGKTSEQLQTELIKAGFKIGDYAKFMLNSKDFKTSKKSEQANLVRLKVRDLFGNQNATTDEIYKKAAEVGLELCPAEVGPNLRLHYKNQPLNEWFAVAMKQISGPGGSPNLFSLARSSGGVWLDSRWAGPSRTWNPDNEFVFRLPSSRK